jgi:hypothetical protein
MGTFMGEKLFLVSPLHSMQMSFPNGFWRTVKLLEENSYLHDVTGGKNFLNL